MDLVHFFVVLCELPKILTTKCTKRVEDFWVIASASLILQTTSTGYVHSTTSVMVRVSVPTAFIAVHV